MSTTPQETPLLQAVDLYKHFPIHRAGKFSRTMESLRAVDGVSLEIKRGDVIAVLGPNGAGKTTFVKHAIGLLKPKSGRVLVSSTRSPALSAWRKSALAR